jgi:phage terminase large subunit-like protein
LAREIKTKYNPHPKQALFHSLRHRFRNRLFFAGIGTGKTLAGCHEAIFMSLANPGFDGLIASPVYPMLRDVILPIWKEFIPKEMYTFYKQDKIFELWTGQRIYLRSLENFDAMRGLNVAWAWADELAMVQNQEAYMVMQGRVGRVKCPCPGIFATTTPRGYNWLVKKWKNGGKDYVTIRARSEDNPYFSRALLEQLMADYSEEEIRQELWAEVVETTGLAWNINHNIHCNWRAEDLRRNKITKVVAGVDWGWSVPSAIIVGARTKDGRWWLVDEFYKKNIVPNDLYREMAHLKRKWNIRTFYCDSAEPARIAEANGKGLRCIPSKKGSGSISRGVQEVRGLLKVRGRIGQPGLMVSPHLKWWHKEVESYHFEDADSDKVVGDDGDHLMDATRYLFDAELNNPQVKGLY